MPRAKKRSALKDKTNAENVVDKEQAERTARVEEMYRNWLVGMKRSRKLLEQRLDARKMEVMREITNAIYHLPSEIKNMTIGKYAETVQLQDSKKETKEGNDEQEVKKVEEKSKKDEKGEILETDNIVCTVDQALMDLQQHSSASEAETKKKPGRKRAKKAPPKTARKGKKHAANSVMETPMNVGPAPMEWTATPFITQTQQRTGLAMESRVLTHHEPEAKDVILKFVCLTANGSPVMYLPPKPLQEEMEKGVQEFQRKMRIAAQGDQSSSR